jgi:hypothetical protein
MPDLPGIAPSLDGKTAAHYHIGWVEGGSGNSGEATEPYFSAAYNDRISAWLSGRS